MNYRKLIPWLPLPLIGIILTMLFHAKYRDTGLENHKIMILSAIYQAVIFIAFFIFLYTK